MDVPAPAAGVVRELSVTVGDNVSEGSILLRIEADGGDARPTADDRSASAHTGAVDTTDAPPAGPGEVPRPDSLAEGATTGDDNHAAIEPADSAPASAPTRRTRRLRTGPSRSARPAVADRLDRGRAAAAVGLHATPAIRRYARELGVDVDKVKGTGRKGASCART